MRMLTKEANNACKALMLCFPPRSDTCQTGRSEFKKSTVKQRYTAFSHSSSADLEHRRLRNESSASHESIHSNLVIFLQLDSLSSTAPRDTHSHRRNFVTFSHHLSLMEEKEEKKVYRAAIFRIGVEIEKDKPLQDRLKKAREAFLPILVVGTKQEWAKEKDNLLEHFAESEFCEVDASTAAKLASAALPRFQKLGLFDLTVDHILNLSEDLASGTWRMNHPAIVMNYDQLTYLHNLFMSEMIPGTGGRLGYMATWKLLQSFVPGVTYHQATRAVRHFADASSVNFDQFVRILVFFLKNIDEYDKEAGLAIDYVLRGEKDMGMQSTGAILIRMYEDLLDKDDASYEAFKQIYTQSTISNDTVAKIKECLLRPRALKKFSKKAQEPERACSFGDGSTQDQRVQRETMVVVDIDQIRYDGKTNNTPVRVLIGVCGEEEKTDFYNAPKGIDVLVAQRKTLKVTFKFIFFSNMICIFSFFRYIY